MHPIAFLALSTAAWSMSAAGLAALAITAFGAKRANLTYLCFAVPLAVFGAEHLSMPQELLPLVPSYMPARMFWVYFVGLALIAASLSLALGRLVRWSGLLFGIMMLLFVAMLHLPGAIRAGSRIPWTIVFREMSFGAAGLALAGIAFARFPIAATAIFFGVEHFLHPLGLPGVPLEKQMPPWVPLRIFIDYVTGASLVVAGACFLFNWKTRIAARYVGGWIVLLVLLIYGPVLIGALRDPHTGVQVEGINYFADTLLFAGVILSMAGPKSSSE
jgi:uncharacterized membrane protein